MFLKNVDHQRSTQSVPFKNKINMLDFSIFRLSMLSPGDVTLESHIYAEFHL